jgi:Abnormal spindle-like microcephaly-assoc'd, ASPM-SPD-2-Hydin
MSRSRVFALSAITLFVLGSCLSAQAAEQTAAAIAAPNPVVFGDHEIGVKTTVAVTLSNKTNSKLRFMPQRADKADYVVDKDGCDAEVAPNGSCTFTISFSPHAAGDRSGTVQIEYMASADGKDAKPFPVALTGKGTLPDLGLSTRQLLFSPQRVLVMSLPQAVTLTNNGQKELAITSLSASGDFSVEPANSPAPLKPGDSTVALVRFRPKHEGAATGILTIFSTSGVSPQTVDLSGSTPKILANFYSSSVYAEVLFVAALCLLYWLAMVVVRWHRVALPARALLRAGITALRTELEILVGGDGSSGAAKIKTLLDAASDLIDRKASGSGYGLADFLFWSRGQEITGWGYLHEAEIQMAQFLREATVTARLESTEQRLRLMNDAPSLALANEIHEALTGSPAADLARRRALLAEAFSANYQREDITYTDLISWQNKASWLVGCGLGLILVLSGVVRHHSIIFLVGGLGGLLSRLSRSLDRKDVPTDYGASWTTLFLSPVAGALGAWAGILLSGLAVQLNILGPAFNTDWTDPSQPMALAIALVFGFSERLFDSVLDKVVGKSGIDQTAATNPQPPQRTGDANPGTPGADGKVVIPDPKLPVGTVGVPYLANLSVTGAAGTVQWSTTQGSLPPDLQLGQDGQISGRPKKEGVYDFTVGVSDQTSKSLASRPLTLTIKPAV